MSKLWSFKRMRCWQNLEDEFKCHLSEKSTRERCQNGNGHNTTQHVAIASTLCILHGLRALNCLLQSTNKSELLVRGFCLTVSVLFMNSNCVDAVAAENWSTSFSSSIAKCGSSNDQNWLLICLTRSQRDRWQWNQIDWFVVGCQLRRVAATTSLPISEWHTTGFTESVGWKQKCYRISCCRFDSCEEAACRRWTKTNDKKTNAHLVDRRKKNETINPIRK